MDADDDGQSDNWLTRWDYKYRDVVIVDGNNQPVEVFNLTTHDLADEGNRETLTQMLIAAAESGANSPSWTNAVNALDVNNDTFVSPFDALAVINVLNSEGPHELGQHSGEDYYLDTSGDGFVSPIDALLVLNHLNANSSVTTAARPAADALPADTSTGEPSSEPSHRAQTMMAAAIDAVWDDSDEIEKRWSL